MDYRAKLCEFIDDLNKMAVYSFINSGYNIGKFELSIKEGIVGPEGKDACRIDLYFKEEDISHLVYGKTGIIEYDFFYQVYFDILRGGILGVNSVGQMKDTFGHDVNFLNFATLLTEGLKKLKTT